jgi:hypothetical protein
MNKEKLDIALLLWRKEEVDFEDMIEAEGGCQCAKCHLVRTVDEYLAGQIVGSREGKK